MLVLTQAAVGGFLIDLALRVMGRTVSPLLPWASLVPAFLGMAASVWHLGRPQFAYRAIIGLRHSWLSREVAAFGLFAMLALAHAAIVQIDPAHAKVSAFAATLAGVVGLYCSVMVYHVVRRPFWRHSISGPKFGGTALVLGLALANVLVGAQRSIGFGLIATSAIKLAIDLHILTHLSDPRYSLLRRTALLLCGPLARVSGLRVALGVVGGIVLPAAAMALGAYPLFRTSLASVAFVLLLAGELAERSLFFTAVVRPKMPGGLAA
jgi:DMSO reductase anchor subunit